MVSFSETEPVTAVALTGRHLYAGTPSGLLRFDLASKKPVRIAKADGLGGERVTAVATDRRHVVWAATEVGLARGGDGPWKVFPFDAAARPPIQTLTATGVGVWAAGTRGVARLSGGKWKSYLPGARVRAMLADLAGTGLWIATAGEGIYHYDSGKLEAHSAGHGQPLRDVVAMAHAADGGLFAAGEGRIVYFDGQHWTTYRLDPAGRVRWLARVGQQVLVGVDDAAFAIKRGDLSLHGPKEQPIGPLRLDGQRSAKAPSGYPMPYFYSAPVNQRLPRAADLAIGDKGQLLLGSATVGAARFDGQTLTWYRTRQLAGGMERLRIACGSSDCFLVGADGRAYRETAGRIVRVSVATDSTVQVHAFTIDRAGTAVALHAPRGSATVTVSRWDGKQFVKLHDNVITSPHGPATVRFARYDSTGRLWVGLTYVDRDGQRRPWGLAVLGADGTVVSHRSTLLPSEERTPGSLALPEDVRDIMFHGDEIWVATDSGVCRVRGRDVDLFTENEGLESELVYGMAVHEGKVIIATYAGLGRFDGKQWRFDGERTIARAVESIGPALWIGTDSGLELRSGGATRRFGVGDGLLSADILDLHVDDKRGRLWVLTAEGISIITF